MKTISKILIIAMTGYASVACQPSVGNTEQEATHRSSVAEVADMIVTNAKVSTMDEANSTADALAVKDGQVLATGSAEEMDAYRGENTQVIDANGRRVVPGLNDSHLHATRGGRFYNTELRWDGVNSLERGLQMIGEQAGRTPDGEWVRVIGGWSPYQFAERRMPTVPELNEAAPETPVFVLFLYSQGFLNAAGVKALGITENTEAPPGSRYEFIEGGAILHAEPNPTILYKTIGQLPGLSDEDQVNSTLHFYRDLNRFGLTSAIDAGGGGHLFPDNYGGSQVLAEDGELPIRISYYLFPQRPGQEHEDFADWTKNYEAGHNDDPSHDHGFELEGGGEFLVWSAGDFENFMAARPELADRGNWAEQLHQVASLLVENDWPLRIHATYGESLGQIMDVFEQINEEQGKFAPRWAIDHAETAREEDLQRIKAMGGGVAIQNRMAFAGEYFVDRYGAEAARNAPPVRRMLELDIPIGVGTDATRVSSYNPWVSLYWLVTGKTVGGTSLFGPENQLSREEALWLYTVGSAWFSQEEGQKGSLEAGQMADFALLSDDYFDVDEEAIKGLESVLTVVGGNVVYGAEEFAKLSPELPSISPDWSPVKYYGGYQTSEELTTRR
ncbi:amidohydrolase [Tunicatimonas pelagia]|uniref:amidohydrolase n=1 Tax=Tunicatimonas pelagia TaxID=931531 RepID=UPI0026659886|nr:amidohydrolase [Tunicatimonas pelagia]WKN44849.1 amidohydrolase [Tunicatimonas pelagia]